MNKPTNTTNFRQLLGGMGESLAHEFLVSRGWTIEARNFHSHRLGEIDIIGRPPSSNILAFVEVKTRDIKARDGAFEHTGQEAMRGPKGDRLVRAAMAYLRGHPARGASLRFDLILVDIDLNRRDLEEIVRAGDLAALRPRARTHHLTAVAGNF